MKKPFIGDEFLIILLTPKHNAIETGRFVANRIIKEIRTPFIIEDTTINIGCSIGGAIYPENGVDPEMLISIADKALYYSKNHGKNRVTFHIEFMKEIE